LAQLIVELKERRRGPVLDKNALHYWCTFTAPRDTTTGIPARGDAHPVATGALIVNISADVKGSATFYTCEYVQEQIVGA